MADLTNTTVGANYQKLTPSTSDSGREYIIKAEVRGRTFGFLISDVQNIMDQLTFSTGDGKGKDTNGADAGTWATFGTETGRPWRIDRIGEELYVRLQTSGTPNLTPIREGGDYNRSNSNCRINADGIDNTTGEHHG